MSAAVLPGPELRDPTTVQLTAVAEAVRVLPDCSRNVQRLHTGTWSLTFQAPEAGITDASGLLSSVSGLSSSFLPADTGIYRARFTVVFEGAEGSTEVAITVGRDSPLPEAIKTPWAVLVCVLKDDQQFGAPRTLFERFFTTAGLGTYNAVRFFQEMSHRHLDLTGSQVFGEPALVVDAKADAGPAALVAAARDAARQAGVPLASYYGDVVVFQEAIGGTFGTVDDRPWAFGDFRWVQGNGTEAFGHEMGHAYGLAHSRRDGSTDDYLDPWDIMSAQMDFFGPDPDFTSRGPGLDAANMRGRGWLDESRVWRGPAGNFEEVVSLRPLHRHDMPGFLAAEMPPNDPAGGHGRYLVEFRTKEEWDVGIPRPAILVHRFENNQSYIMRSSGGTFDLVVGDVFDAGARLEVLAIDPAARMATVRLSSGLATDSAPWLTSAGNTFVLFARATDGRIMFNPCVLGQTFQGWSEVDGGGRTDTTPAAAAVGTYMFVVIKGLDGNLYVNQGEVGHHFLGWGRV